jgi:hypothetical protein
MFKGSILFVFLFLLFKKVLNYKDLLILSVKYLE